METATLTAPEFTASETTASELDEPKIVIQSLPTPEPWSRQGRLTIVAGDKLLAVMACQHKSAAADAQIMANGQRLLAALKQLQLEAIHYRDSGVGRQFLDGALAEADAAITAAVQPVEAF